MADKKSFLLRLDARLYDEIRRRASAELRSVNGQIEFILRRWLEQKRTSDPQPHWIRTPACRRETVVGP